MGVNPWFKYNTKWSRDNGDRKLTQPSPLPMSTFTKLTYHIIFSTKYRKHLIKGAFQKRLYEYIGGIIRAQNGHLIEIGGIADHVHILANFPPTKSISDTLRELKSNTSKWSNTQPECLHSFDWQKGYSAFSVSYSQIENVRSYITNQEEHHREKSFEEEYLLFLKLHNIPFEPHYVFEAEHQG